MRILNVIWKQFKDKCKISYFLLYIANKEKLKTLQLKRNDIWNLHK